METLTPDARQRSRERRIALALFVAGLLLRLPFLGEDEGWFDELFSVFASAEPLADIVRNSLAEQTNPPGYHLVAHLWNALGDGSLAWLRLLSSLGGSTVAPLIYLTARRLRISNVPAVTAATLATLNWLVWSLSLEARAYALHAGLAALALWLAARFVEDDAPTPRAWMALAAVLAALPMLHYFGAFTVASVAIAVAAATWRPERGGWRRAITACLALGVPAAAVLGLWLWLAFNYKGGIDGRVVAWIPEVALPTAVARIPRLFASSMTPWDRIVAQLLAGAALIAVSWAALRGATGHDARRARFVLAAVVVGLGLALAAHVASDGGLWVPRYLVGTVPAMALLIALGLEHIPLARRAVVTVVIGIWWSAAATLQFFNRTPKPDWSAILHALAPNGPLVICSEGAFASFPLLYYAGAQGRSDVRVVSTSECRPSDAATWLVYAVSSTGQTEAPTVPGARLGPRVALFRGIQSLDARRVLSDRQSPPAPPRPPAAPPPRDR